MEKPNNFCIVRLQKIKSLQSLKRSFKHVFREQKTPNADSEKLGLNINLSVNNSGEGMALFKNKLPARLRKNGVIGVEHVITASPDFFKNKSREDVNEYFSKSIGFFNDFWGEENVLSGNVHFDETTPHMHLFVCPVDQTTGRLNCRKWLGKRDALTKLQDDFFNSVGQSYGLERGVKGSKAKHKSIKQYYTELNSVEKAAFESRHPLTKGDFARAATVGSSKVENVLEMAFSLPFLKNEFEQTTKKGSEQIHSLISTNELLRQKNNILNERHERVGKVENEALLIQMKNKQLKYEVAIAENENKELKQRQIELESELRKMKVKALQLNSSSQKNSNKYEDNDDLSTIYSPDQN
jgi:hypothetical protein